MPIFEYECEVCKYRFERIVKKWTDIKECPNCKGKIRKLPTAASFRFGDQQSHPNHPDNVEQAKHERKQKQLK